MIVVLDSPAGVDRHAPRTRELHRHGDGGQQGNVPKPDAVSRDGHGRRRCLGRCPDGSQEPTRAAAPTATTRAKVVVADAGQLHGYVQQIVNASPENAEAIAAQAAMTLRKKGSKSKPTLAVKQTVSGTVTVVAKATKGARINEWQYSTDGGKTWKDLPPTTKAKTLITGLTPGVTVSYRQRAVTKDGRSDWCPTLSAVVQ